MKVIPIAVQGEPTRAVEGVQVLQHNSAEYLGLIEDHLEGRGVRFRYSRPFAGKNPLPAADALGDGLILLGGGPWGSAGTRDVPTLKEEVALAKAALSQDKPILGFGLGAQILAIAAGGGAQASPLAFEVGTARRTSSDALNGYLPEEYSFAVYMRDWPVPPAGARVLARDERGRPALWQVGERALGFAGHPGLKVAMVEDLIMEFEEAPLQIEAGLARLRQVQRSIEDALVPIMTGVVQLTGWIKPPA
ncbi:MAG TPA: gamma-glutamyl-gamma-aminobutyrate hydrolase family protein [Burkholderiales bacterium]|nr:gamma-glutamyl-gamma-aminobutyrate hydrolase family protein [Burkholderiales bacterium]